jgi:hypothetical protein
MGTNVSQHAVHLIHNDMPVPYVCQVSPIAEFPKRWRIYDPKVKIPIGLVVNQVFTALKFYIPFTSRVS